jgi:hypothetical protein
VSAVTPTEVEIEDPAEGLRRVPSAEFASSWTGALIFAREGPTIADHRTHVREYHVEERLLGLPTSMEFLVAGQVVCPTAAKLLRDDSRRELAVIARRKDGWLELRVAVPLDDALAPSILNAVRARLSASAGK